MVAGHKLPRAQNGYIPDQQPLEVVHTYTSRSTMQAFDPELAALLVAPPAPPNDGPPHVPTIAELRAHFDRYVAGPFIAYQQPLLPAGEYSHAIGYGEISCSR